MRRMILTAAVAAALPALIGFVWPGTVEWLTTRGVRQYNAEKFEEAQKAFNRALEADPGNHTLQFNRGTALQRQDAYDAASEAFTAAAKGADDDLAQDATYNLGNARFRAGDFAGAIEAYKQALRMNPEDGHARYNLELALRKQQEHQQQNQEDQQNKDDQEQDQQNQQQNDEEQPPEQEQQQQQGEEQQDGDQQDQPSEQPRPDEQEPEQQMSQPQQAEEGELTQAQAERLLHALASQDAEMQKLIRRAPQRRQPRGGEKDW